MDAASLSLSGRTSRAFPIVSPSRLLVHSPSQTKASIQSEAYPTIRIILRAEPRCADIRCQRRTRGPIPAEFTTMARHGRLLPWMSGGLHVLPVHRDTQVLFQLRLASSIRAGYLALPATQGQAQHHIDIWSPLYFPNHVV